MDSKIAEFLSKVMLEGDENDVVSFAFPNEARKIKCSISILSEISPVFEAMFSARWQQKEQPTDDDELLDLPKPLETKTIKLGDDDQYLAFKLFMQILYGFRSIDSLSVDQAKGVYVYSHKYQIGDIEDKIKKFLNQRMESGMSNGPFSLTELVDGIEFAKMYQLDEFASKLDQVKVEFDEDNPVQYFELAEKFEMNGLKQQVLDHLKTVEPKDDWTPDMLRAVIASMRAEKEAMKNEMFIELVKKAEFKHRCNSHYVLLYCPNCGTKSNKQLLHAVSEFQKM